jgi:hypothetical protein
MKSTTPAQHNSVAIPRLLLGIPAEAQLSSRTTRSSQSFRSFTSRKNTLRKKRTSLNLENALWKEGLPETPRQTHVPQHPFIAALSIEPYP